MNQHPLAEEALLLAAISNAGDPIQRFIDARPNEEPFRARDYANETVRMHAEYLSHVQRADAETDPRQANAHAEWIARHVHEVTCRWVALRRAITRWSEIGVAPRAFRWGAER